MNDFRSFLVKLHIAENTATTNCCNNPLINIVRSTKNVYSIYAD